MGIKEILSSLYKLSENSINLLMNNAEVVEYSKGHILSQAGKSDPYIYILEKGIVRAYSMHDGTEVTFWFGMENDMIYSMQNYIENKPSYENIELLEDCRLYRIHSNIMFHLYEKHVDIANWGRKFMERELLKLENRMIEQQFMNATERYHSLFQRTPTLFQRVPLGIIASYLGITQVSLSRIRSKG